MTFPLCRNCQYFQNSGIRSDFALCYHPKAAQKSLVYGFTSASNERRWGNCGSEGKLFKPFPKAADVIPPMILVTSAIIFMLWIIHKYV